MVEVAKERKQAERGHLYRGERFGRLARFTDSVISAINPARGVKRLQARAMASHGYDITSRGRTRRAHIGAGGSADSMQKTPDLKVLRETSRHHKSNSAVYEAIMQRGLDNVLGPEMEFDPVTGDRGWNKAAKEYVKFRMVGADARGLMEYPDLRRAALSSVWVDGDILLAHTEDDTIQGFEADQLMTPRGDTSRKIVSGVQVGDKGRVRGYWVGDRNYRAIRDTDTNPRFIPAGAAVLPANRDRLSQTRGKPVLSSSMDFFDRIDGYLDSESLAAWINACLVLWIRENQEMAASRGTMRAGEESKTKADGSTDILQQFDRAAIMNLGPGEDAGAFESKRPGDNFAMYLKTSFTLIGASVGLPLILLLLDFSDVNYSSARAALQEARKAFRRWQGFVRRYIDMPMYARWIGQAIARDILTPREDAFGVTFRPPGWPYVDPVKEVVADRESVAALFKSQREIIAARGRNIDEVLAEIAEDKQKAEDLGLPSSIWTPLEVKTLLEPDRKAKDND